MAKNTPAPSVEVVPVEPEAPVPAARVEKAPHKPSALEDVGQVVSRLSTPVIFDYGDQKIRLSARGKTENDLIRGKLGKLPTGLVFVAK